MSWNGRSCPNQNHSGASHRRPALEGDLKKVLVEREDDPSLRFGTIEQRAVFHAWEIRSRPNHIVALLAQTVDNRAREIFVGQKLHSGRNQNQAGIG